MKVNSKYITDFVRLKCAPELLELNIFPNAKEITESFGCYNAVRTHIWDDVNPKDDSVILFAVGDGHVPRTACTFAFRTAWTCVSIDPLMRNADNTYRKYEKVNRVYVRKDRVENINDLFVEDLRNRTVIIALVHSHAQINDCYKILHGAKTYVISIPCCVNHNNIKGILPNIQYKDDAIWTPKNEIKIWKM